MSLKGDFHRAVSELARSPEGRAYLELAAAVVMPAVEAYRAGDDALGDEALVDVRARALLLSVFGPDGLGPD